MEYYSILPNEIKGNINSFLSDDVTSELKYSNRDTFNSMRYVNTLHDNIVYLRRLFIKNNLNNTYTPFYYNLTSIKGKLIVSSNIDELLLAHRVIKKLLHPIEIIYTGNSIVTLSPLIQTFIESKCPKMEVYLKKDMLYFFIIERRDDLIVANILPILCRKEMSLYLKGVDSLLLNESYNTTSSYCSKNRNILKEIKLDGEYASDILVEDSKEILYHNKLVEFIIQHNIHTLHLSEYGMYPEFSEILQLVDTLYIVSFDNRGQYGYFGFIEEMDEIDANTIIFPGITKVVMEHILISNQIEERHTPYYKIHSRLLPNAIIEVFKMNESDIIEGDNINIVEDNARVKSLERQRLSNLLLADRNIRFPNLNNISEITVGMDEYDDSVDYIRKLIKVVDSLRIIIEVGEQRILPDILKYSVLMGNVVKKKLIIATNAAYDKRIKFSFTLTTVGVQFEVNTRNLTKDDYYDISYLFLHDDIIIKAYQQQTDLAFDLVNKLGQTKIILSGSACNTKHYIRCLPDNIDTLYIYDRHLPTLVKEIAGMKPNTNIKNIFYDCEENIKLLEYTNISLKTIFPNCIFHIIDNIYSTQLYLNY